MVNFGFGKGKPDSAFRTSYNYNKKNNLKQIEENRTPNRKLLVIYLPSGYRQQAFMKKFQYPRFLKKQAQEDQQIYLKSSILEDDMHQETPQNSVEKIEKSEDIVLLLGTLGVGKKQIMRKLFPKSELQDFVPMSSQQCNMAVAPSFDFEQNIDSRESQIKLYQQFFIKYGNKIKQLCIVVNFERTDLMKKKVSSVFKYFRKFKHLITVIVTQFQLSENQDCDKISLQQAFKLYSLREIIFLNSDDTLQDILTKLRPCLNCQDDKIEFDLSNTIFELENIEETKMMLDKLNSLSEKIQVSKSNQY